jgi:RimJ/RimL family protein N-acetyltransferase
VAAPAHRGARDRAGRRQRRLLRAARAVEIGYGLVEGARHQGYASEAVAGLLAAAQAAGIRLVVAHTLPDNVPSQAVLLRNGFLPTGRNEDGEPRFERRLS